MIKKLIKKILGIKDVLSSYEDFCKVKFEWANNKEFNDLYSLALKKTDDKSYLSPFLPHKMRSYNLVGILKLIPKEGEIAECGVFKGTTAYEIRTVAKKQVHLFDSFEGISGREAIDSRRPEEIGGRGIIACPLEDVKRNLSDFKDWKYYKGWIPDRFKEVENLKFAFVHVDVDVYQPTRDSFDFFYPRLVPGGIMVCDDYGFTAWPGAKKAVDEMAIKHDFKVLSLTTGQAVVFKR